MFGMSWIAGRWWLGLVLAWVGLFAVPSARAADYSVGVELSGSTATLWFRSNVNTSWVDAHYSLDGGAQQNVRMTYNATTGRHETRFTASTGQTVSHWFTYNNGNAAYDSATGSTLVGDGSGGGGSGGGGSGGGSSGGTSGITQGADAASGGAVLWLSGSGVQWVDIHYDAGSGQQNLRMTYNGARYEALVAAAAGAVIRYSFTYFTAAGAADTALYSTTVGGGGTTPRAATPGFRLPAGRYSSAQTVALSTATPGAEIRYTLDGSTPGASSALYGAPISVTASTTIKAIARMSGMLDSAEASASYEIASAAGFAQGVSELGATATVWRSCVSSCSASVACPMAARMPGSAATARHPSGTGWATAWASACACGRSCAMAWKWSVDRRSSG